MSSETFNLEQSLSNNSQLTQPEKEKEISELDFSLAEPLPESETLIEVKDEVKDDSNVEALVSTQETEGSLDFSQGEEVKVSNLEKLEYAFDKNTQIIGNVWRISKAKVQDIFDDEKTFKDYILSNRATEEKDIYKEHWKFKSGKYDDDGIVKAGEIATLMLDPGYILAYATPWGRAALKSYKMASLMGGLTIGADVALRDLATKGEINYGKVGISSTLGVVLGPLAPAVTKIFKKFAPQSSQKQIDEVVEYIDTKIAKREGITKKQLFNLRNVSQDAEVIAANKNLSTWSNANFMSPVVNEIKKVKGLEKIIKEKNEALRILHTSTKGTKKAKGKVPGMLKPTRTFRQTILDNRAKVKEANIALEAAKVQIYKNQIPKIKKYSELVATRDTLILEKLQATESSLDFAVRYLVSATIKPLGFGAMGAGAGVIFGDEDTKLINWFIGGAVIGKTQKYIQASKKFKLADKNKVLGIIDSDYVKYTLQQLRSMTSATSSTKLNSYGGATERVGRMLLETIDSSVSQKSVIANAERLQREYTAKAFNLVQGFSAAEQSSAVSIVRGKKITTDTPQNVVQLSKNIQTYLDEFKTLYNDSGFFSKTEISDYFPRVLNWEKINRNEKGFQEVLTGIFKSLKAKDPTKSAKDYMQGHKSGSDSVFNREALEELFQGFSKTGASKNKLGKEFIYTPISEHIAHERSLNGPYKLVEEILEKNGYLVNDVASILTNLTTKSMRSISFTRQFGENGQLLKPFFKEIRDKYIASGMSARDANIAAAKEGNLVANTVDAYFDRYGTSLTGSSKQIAVVLSTLSNLNMLGRVTISSLGDLVQPFQNSSQFSSWFKALPVVGVKGTRTALTAKGETGISKDLNYAITNEIRVGLSKPLATEQSNLALNTSWMGEGPITSKINNVAFKALGLQWLTGFARRFAYNVGAGDIFGLSKSLAKVVKAQGIDSRKAQLIIADLSKYGVKPSEALNLSKFTSMDLAIKNAVAKKTLGQAGIVTSNRDALVPQLSNRLLFTQSQNQASRLMGQFMSWAMAKSAQTNKVIGRIENGNTKTLLKTLAVIPVYSAIANLRELAKYGTIITDYNEDNKRWWAEGLRLSGMQGILADLVVNKTVGPGGRDPWFLIAPSFQIAKAIGEVPIELLKGNTDRALRIFSQKIAPLPNWRNSFSKWWSKSKPLPANKNLTNTIKPLNFNSGDIVTLEKSLVNNELINNEKQNINLVKEKNEKQISKTEIKKQAEKSMKEGFPIYENKKGERISLEQMQKEIQGEKEKNMNIKDVAKVGAVVTGLATGVNADVVKKTLPVEQNKTEVISKRIDYNNLPELAKDKQKFLLDAASVIYQNNKGKDVPNDILLAIAIEETGYGTGRFYKEGNSYFNMIAEKGDNRIKATGDSTQVAKFETPAGSLEKFYTWVETKPHYKGVREVLQKYKDGEATKNDIIDAISDTGWAENKNWGDSVKSILKKRVNGKHSKELLLLENSLFKK